MVMVMVLFTGSDGSELCVAIFAHWLMAIKYLLFTIYYLLFTGGDGSELCVAIFAHWLMMMMVMIMVLMLIAGGDGSELCVAIFAHWLMAINEATGWFIDFYFVCFFWYMAFDIFCTFFFAINHHHYYQDYHHHHYHHHQVPSDFHPAAPLCLPCHPQLPPLLCNEVLFCLWYLSVFCKKKCGV